MPTKTIRTWVYALLKYKNKIVVIKKWRWPFTWLYDLPGWKIEHGENNIDSLKREIIEEVWLSEWDFKIDKILTVEEDFVQYNWKWQEKDEHIGTSAKYHRKNKNLYFLDKIYENNFLISYSKQKIFE